MEESRLDAFFRWKGEHASYADSVVDWFLSLEKQGPVSLEVYLSWYKERMPDHLIPIAFDPFGNLVCLSIRRNDRGAVYFWDHEGEALVVGAKQPYYGNLSLVADSFNEFLNSLTE